MAIRAVPLTGSFDIVGQFQAENAAGANVPFGSATAIDFCNNTSGACGPSPGAGGTGTGAFMVTQATAGNNLGLSTTGGEGILKRAGFDDTAGTFSFTGQTDGVQTVGTFSFSGASAALPVPEPASLALFGAGLLGLGLVRRRGCGPGRAGAHSCRAVE